MIYVIAVLDSRVKDLIKAYLCNDNRNQSLLILDKLQSILDEYGIDYSELMEEFPL